jgi:hypothetical protein
MTLAKLMTAASVLAVAGAANAQTSTNTSEISQTGTNNRLAIDNARAGNDQNQSVAIQNGFDNSATVIQIGDFNSSQVQQIGDANLILHTEEGDFQQAESYQQGDRTFSAIRQRGQSNSATVDQVGDRNASTISQGVEATADRDYSFSEFFDPAVAATRLGNNNRARVSQVGDDLFTVVRQRAAAGSSAAASNNVARVEQRGQGSSATVLQESRGNSASIFQFDGGNSAALQNVTSVEQRSTAATASSNPLSGNVANVAVGGQSNSTTLTQNGRNNDSRVSQGLGTLNIVQITQIGSDGTNRVAVGQYGTRNATAIAQDSVSATANVWQQPGPASSRSSNNSAEIQQGTGTTGSASFSAGFFGNTAPSGNQTRNLTASIVQGNGSGPASWNVAQVRQDGIDLAANVQQAGTGISGLPNIVQIAQQGGSNGGNSARAVQRGGVGPSVAGDPASGQAGDPFFFAGGARSAEINILQSGSSNSASVEQRGRGQYARVEQGPGSGNIASILQEAAATNATAIIQQSGSNNSYNVVQTASGQYIAVSQTGNNNTITNVVQRP